MQELLATYVHHLDPFAVRFTENFGIRWYGLAYVGGFAAAYFLLRWFVRIGASELKESQVADFITLCAVVGTMLGGRLGYMLFYNFDSFVANPLSFFDFLGGGMSSHGGMLGITIVAWFFAWRTGTSWAGHGDNLVTVAPIGLFLGRLANFINGELYGRPTESRLAMKFPEELNDMVKTSQGSEWKFPLSQLRELAERAQDVAPGLLEKFDALSAQALANGQDAHFFIVKLLQESAQDNPAFRSLLGTLLTPRHPSQLYEAAVEGLLLFLIMLSLRLKWRNAWHGMLTGIFFLLYAVGRIVVENYREPDSSLILGMTKGQFYSIFLVAAGIAFLAYGVLRRRRNRPPQGRDGSPRTGAPAEGQIPVA